MARYSLTAGSNVNASSNFATATITPGAGRLVLAFVLSRRAGGAGLPTASGNGLTWHQVAGTLDAAAGNTRITCFRAMGPAPSAGPLTFNFAGQRRRSAPGRYSSTTTSTAPAPTGPAPCCNSRRRAIAARRLG